MNVLIIGRGGREHALAWKVRQSKIVNEVFVAPGNDGMNNVATCVEIDEMAIDELIQFAKEKQIDLTIVGPEAPLMAGIVNRFQEENLRIFGPTKEAAMIEGSKQFAKDLMKKYNIATANYDTFTSVEEAKTFVKKHGVPIVIKADGLAQGKGVVIAQTVEAANQAIEDMLSGNKFGNAGHKVVIEEFLEGEECSLMAFVNGKDVYPMVLSQDHKRAYDNDEGPNTGGMGAYSPVPQIADDIVNEAVEDILKPIVQALDNEGCSFTGILYAGLIVTKQGPKVIEFNARFGDPEAQVVLMRLQSDLVEVILNLLDQKPVELKWSNDAVVGVVLATKGYPNTYEKGLPLQIEDIDGEKVEIFHAGTKRENNKWVTNGGRLLLVACQRENIEAAYKEVYEQMERIKSPHTFYRKDIGLKGMTNVVSK